MTRSPGLTRTRLTLPGEDDLGLQNIFLFDVQWKVRAATSVGAGVGDSLLEDGRGLRLSLLQSLTQEEWLPPSPPSGQDAGRLHYAFQFLFNLVLKAPPPPVSRYSYLSRAPRSATSTIWDYNFSTSRAAGGDSQSGQEEKKEKNFSFVPRTENKPEPSTAEKVRLGSGSGESRQSRARTRKTVVTNITEEEKKQRNPLKLPSWQLNRPVSLLYFISSLFNINLTDLQKPLNKRPVSASGAPPKASPEILSPLSSSPPPLKSCLKAESRTNSLGRNVKISQYSPATPSKYNVNFKHQDTPGIKIGSVLCV